MAATSESSTSNDASLPVVDLRLVSQPELFTLSFSHDTGRNRRIDDDAVIPRIDRSVFNESAGSRKQTFSRLNFRNNNNPNSSVPVPVPVAPAVPAPESSSSHIAVDEENSQIIDLLQRLFGVEALRGANDDRLVPFQGEFKQPAIEFTPQGIQSVVIGGVDGSQRKRKRGRPRRDESPVTDMQVKETSLVVVGEGDMEMVEAVNEQKVEAVNKKKGFVLEDVGDPFVEQLIARTQGMNTEAQLSEFLEGLNGVWASDRKKRRIVDANIICDLLPTGWKLILILQRRGARASVVCRRYVSPDGRQFESYKEVSSYLDGSQPFNNINMSSENQNVGHVPTGGIKIDDNASSLHEKQATISSSFGAGKLNTSDGYLNGDRAIDFELGDTTSGSFGVSDHPADDKLPLKADKNDANSDQGCSLSEDRVYNQITTPQNSKRDANNPAGLLSIAEETLTEFLSKATGTAVDWVQMPGMKPGPDSVGIFAISQSGSGVAARACGLVSLEPTKIAEILKDRLSWFRECRNLEVFTMFPAGNGGTVELVYTQTYAPTTLAPARDFWTLRYTTTLENGSIVVCERSLSGSGTGPNPAVAAQFVRAETLPSGYLIRPCDGGGSIIHIVDHLNLEPWSVPEVLRPLYESPKVVAQKMTIAALRYIRQIAQESSGEVVYGLGRQPAVLRTFSQRLSRGFNDAVNGFNDDGWSILNCDGAEDVIIAVNSTKNLSSTSNPASSLTFLGGILCAKASMLLQNVPPAVLVRFLREHRSEWADFNVDAYCAASLKAGNYAYPGMRPTRFTGNQIIMPLGHTIEHEEMLEVIRLEGHSLAQEDAFVSRDIHLLQICSGTDENAVGTCSELIFAPIDEMFPDDAPLVPSGFRIIPLDSKPGDKKDTPNSNRTLDLMTSGLEVGPATTHGGADSSSSQNTRSVLTIAFQFPFDSNMQNNVVIMARQYVRSVISSVQRVAMAISPSGINPAVGAKLSPGSPEAVTLAHWICQSYSYYLGSDLLRSDSLVGDLMLKQLWHHPDAILCCSLKSQPVFVFANQAGLDMLETTLVALQDITLDKIFDESGRKALCGDFAKLMQQGFAYLPTGMCMSTMGRHVSYEQAISWKVLTADDNSVHCLAFSFINWSFV